MTIGEYLSKTNKDFKRYKFLANLYGTIGTIFKSKKCLDKSVYYLDKRWNMMMTLLNKHSKK